MHATKLVPAVVDKKGNVVSERAEVPDHGVRVKAAAEIADFVRLVSGLTADPPSRLTRNLSRLRLSSRFPSGCVARQVLRSAMGRLSPRPLRLIPSPSQTGTCEQ